MGSPSGVPEPCASTASTSAQLSEQPASASWMTRCCAGPLGAVRPLDAPSWLTAEPRTTASTGWPLRRASESRSSTTMPAPSAMPMPSASAAKDFERPSGASPRCLLTQTNSSGVEATNTPPASARVHSPERSACAARWTATSAEEQAVSTVIAGPWRPRV